MCILLALGININTSLLYLYNTIQYLLLSPRGFSELIYNLSLHTSVFRLDHSAYKIGSLSNHDDNTEDNVEL